MEAAGGGRNWQQQCYMTSVVLDDALSFDILQRAGTVTVVATLRSTMLADAWKLKVNPKKHAPSSASARTAPG